MPKGWFGERRRHSEAARRGWRKRIKRSGKRATQMLHRNAFSITSDVLLITPHIWSFFYKGRASKLTKDEAKMLKKKMNLSKANVQFLPFSEIKRAGIVGRMVAVGGGGAIIPAQDKYKIYSHMDAPTLAHELGHVQALEHKKLGKIFRNRYFRAYRGLLELFPFPVLLLRGKKRKVVILATMTPAVVEEGLASYYGYKGLKKLKGKVSTGEKISLLTSPISRIGVAMSLKDIQKNTDTKRIDAGS